MCYFLCLKFEVNMCGPRVSAAVKQRIINVCAETDQSPNRHLRSHRTVLSVETSYHISCLSPPSIFCHIAHSPPHAAEHRPRLGRPRHCHSYSAAIPYLFSTAVLSNREKNPLFPAPAGSSSVQVGSSSVQVCKCASRE